MAITITNADKALKTYYLDAISSQLNDYVNPFFASIEKNSNNVYGKEVRKLVINGINGGIGAGTEDGALPKASGNNYKEIVSTLKNLYGTIEISDKAIRASGNNSGAFVNLLNAEMDGLISASKFNFSRMLFGDGNGVLGKVREVNGNVLFLDDLSIVAEGMMIEFRDADGQLIEGVGVRKVLGVNYRDEVVEYSGELIEDGVLTDAYACIQGSWGNEITGLKTIFNEEEETIYGLNKMENPWLIPTVEYATGEISELFLQKVIDKIEQASGSQPNFIICSLGVRRAIQKALSANRTQMGSMELAGGYNAMSYNGIPIVADRFCPKGTMYILNTNDFELNQLCDWQWLSDDDGKILKQVAGKPVYTASLVKYAELICSRPNAQGVIYNIDED